MRGRTPRNGVTCGATGSRSRAAAQRRTARGKARGGPSTYSKSLRDPRWQRMRLQVMERASWRCEWCGDGEHELQVHHGYYGKSHGVRRPPWEVPLEVLYCLCDACHEKAEVAKQALYLEIGRIPPWEHLRVRAMLRRS
jgi:hypothetical protein